MHWNTFANFAAESCSNICAHGRPVRWLLYGGRCKICSTVAVAVAVQCSAVQCSAGPSYAVITWQTNRPTDCKDCQQYSNTTVCTYKCECECVCVCVCSTDSRFCRCWHRTELNRPNRGQAVTRHAKTQSISLTVYKETCTKVLHSICNFINTKLVWGETEPVKEWEKEGEREREREGGNTPRQHLLANFC